MGYHPETMVASFPPYPKGGASLGGERKPWSFGRWLYSLDNWIGFDVWHIDPERRTEGQRTDDSCGWFDRRPGEYADAVRYLLCDESTMFEIKRALATRCPVTHDGKYTYPRLPLSESLAVCLMVASELELRRGWNGQSGNGAAHASAWLKMFTRERIVMPVAVLLALNPLDNLSACEEPEDIVRILAAALNRHFRPWWKHPRWHVHHWQINFHLPRNLKRMFQPCATCGKGLGFGVSPYDLGDGRLHHSECVGRGATATSATGDPDGR